MSFIPSVRGKFIPPQSIGTKTTEQEPQKNPYWQGNMLPPEKDFANGYDEAVREVNSFFSNIEVFEEMFLRAGFLLDRADAEKYVSDPPFGDACLSDEFSDDYKDYDSYPPEELAKMSRETLLLLAMKSAINDWLEMSRDNTLVALIDSHPEPDERETESQAENKEDPHGRANQ